MLQFQAQALQLTSPYLSLASLRPAEKVISPATSDQVRPSFSDPCSPYTLPSISKLHVRPYKIAKKPYTVPARQRLKQHAPASSPVSPSPHQSGKVSAPLTTMSSPAVTRSQSQITPSSRSRRRSKPY